MGILCFAFTGGNGMLSGNLLSTQPVSTQVSYVSRGQLVMLAENEIGVREQSGRNDGKRVEEYLRCVGLKKGQPWCAAFVSYIYYKGGYPKPRSGWSPALFPASRLARSALPGNLIGIYFPEYKRIAHVGLIEKQDGDWILSIEGNTGIAGSREGDGVYRKRRQVRTIYKISDWISEKGFAP